MVSAFSPMKIVRYVLARALPFARARRQQQARRDRKAQRRSRKPAPLVSGLQMFRRLGHTSRASNLRSSSRSSSFVSHSSGWSSALSHSSSAASPGPSRAQAPVAAAVAAPAPAPNPVPTPPVPFEDEAAADPRYLDFDNTFLEMELARLQLRTHRNGGYADIPDPFADPSAALHFERQTSRDRVSLELMPNQMPPIFFRRLAVPPSPLRTPPSFLRTPSCFFLRSPRSSFLRLWREWKGELEAQVWDRRVVAYAQGDTTAERWARYEKKWAFVLSDTEDSPPLAFCHVPWPIPEIAYGPEHITPEKVHRYLFCTDDLDTVTLDMLPRLAREIRRWRADTFRKRVLPLVLNRQRDFIAGAAEIVYDILLAAELTIKRNALLRKP